MILRIAILEDMEDEYLLLSKYIKEYAESRDITVHIKWYQDGMTYLMSKEENFDLMFLDIEMKHLDGMSTARKIRKKDQTVALVFVTHLSQYAIEGYQVNAMDYILKPLKYPVFEEKMKKIVDRVERLNGEKVVLDLGDSIEVVSPSEIYYVEKDKNYLVYHTAKGEYRIRGTMAQKEDQMAALGFAVNTSGCMVNLGYVTKMEKDSITVAGNSLPISRARRELFQEQLLDYLRGGR